MDKYENEGSYGYVDMDVSGKDTLVDYFEKVLEEE